MAYLLDSDVVIAHLKDDEEALALIDRLSEDLVSISVITYMEAYQGVIRSPDLDNANQKFNAFMTRVPARWQSAVQVCAKNCASGDGPSAHVPWT